MTELVRAHVDVLISLAVVLIVDRVRAAMGKRRVWRNYREMVAMGLITRDRASRGGDPENGTPVAPETAPLPRPRTEVA